MAIEELVRKVAETLEKEGNTRAIFGEPIKLDTKTLIPVACVAVGGAGAGVSPKADQRGFGAGGGGGLNVMPVGFIHEQAGEIVFTPIHLDVKGRPFLTEASQGIGRAIDTMMGTFSAYARQRLASPGKAEVKS